MRHKARGAAISLLCGIVMAMGSALPFVMPFAEPESARSIASLMILVGGLAEIAVGRFGVHVERGPTDVALGLLSLLAASILTFVGEIGALSFTMLLSAWLLARGAAELVGGLAASGEIARVAAARFVRGSADLVLGAVALIGSLATAFPAFLLDWPATIVRAILIFVAISLLASGALHVMLAIAFGRARR
jgi:uncharacterized membrane protein HdeD (DUF308 family)